MFSLTFETIVSRSCRVLDAGGRLCGKEITQCSVLGGNLCMGDVATQHTRIERERECERGTKSISLLKKGNSYKMNNNI